VAGILQIGASVNVAELKAGFDDAAQHVRSTAAGMSGDFQRLAAESEASTTEMAAGMSGDFQRLAAESEASTTEIASNWVTVAQASLALRSAQADVRSATLAAKEAEEGDTAALARLALAKRDAAIASEAQAAAIKAATVGAVEEEEVLGALTERLIGTAEASKLAEGSMAGFAGIAGLLGGGILLGLFAHFEDAVAKDILALRNLSDETLIDIQTLAGLKGVAAQLGVPFEAVETGLIRMAKAQQLAVEGGKGQVEAFARLGISVNELKSLTPEELFYRIAQAVRESGSAAAVAASDVGIFGRGGAALIPIFRQAGDNLKEMITEAGRASGVTREAAAAEAEWTKGMAELNEWVHSVGASLLIVLVPAIKYTGFAFEALATLILTVFETIATGAVAAGKGIWDVGAIVADVASGNIAKAAADVTKLQSDMVKLSVDSAKEIMGNWKALGSEWDALRSKVSAPAGDKAGDKGPNLPAPAPPGKPDKDNTFDIEVKATEAHQLALLEIERKGYEEEAKLRGDSAQKQQEQMLAFNDRELRIKQDAIAELRGLQGDQNTPDRQASLTAQETAAEDRAALERVAINARANNQEVQDGKEREQALERVLHQLTETQLKETAAQSEQARKLLQEKEQDIREQLSFEEETNNRTLANALKLDDDQLKHHQVSARQWQEAEIAAVNQWEQQALEILQRSEQEEIATYGRETAAYKRMKDQEVQIAQQAADKIQQIEQKSDDQISKTVKSLADSITQTIETGLNSVIEGQKSFSQAMEQMWNGLVIDVVKWIEQIIAKEIETLILSAILGAATGGVSDIAGGTFEGGAMSAAGFASGGIIPRTGFVLAHEKEGVLPRPLTEMLISAANDGGTSSQGPRGGHTFQVNYSPVINHPMKREDLDEHMDYLFSGMRQRMNAFNQ
jgi:hypothetical protein